MISEMISDIAESLFARCTQEEIDARLPAFVDSLAVIGVAATAIDGERFGRVTLHGENVWVQGWNFDMRRDAP